MPNNEITTGRQTCGEFTITYQNNGCGGVIPVIDGVPQPSLTFGYVNENDRQACMALLEQAVRATGGNVPEIQRYLMNAITTAARGIHPDSVLVVDGIEYLISYAGKTAYRGTTPIADLSDIPCELPPDAIRALLIDRIRLAVQTNVGYEFEDDDPDEGEEWYEC